MHPGPVNRGVELSPEVIDGPASLITAQVASGLLVRMAILYEILAGGERPRPVSRIGAERPSPGALADRRARVSDSSAPSDDRRPRLARPRRRRRSA